MSFYKPTQDEIEKHCSEISDILENKHVKSEIIKKPETTNNYPQTKFVEYKNYLIEMHNNSLHLSFEDSKKRLQKNGYGDHLPISLIMNLLIDNIEGKLTLDQAHLSKSILRGNEWTANSLSFDGYLIKYEESYESKNNDVILKTYNDATFFSLFLQKFNYGKQISLKDLSFTCPQLVKLLFSKNFGTLPDVIQDNSSVYIPKKNTRVQLVTGNDDRIFEFKKPTSLISKSIDSLVARSRGCKLI